jgi:two-component sensor histidine kinase
VDPKTIDEVAPAPRMSRTGRALVLGYILLGVWMLLLGPLDRPNLHLILDTGVFLLSSVLAWAFWNVRRVTGRGFPSWLSVSFVVAAALEGVHALVNVEWAGVLAPIHAAAGVLRPATWPPAGYVLPLGVILGVLFFRRPGTNVGVLAAALAAMGASLLLLFQWLPSYSQPTWFGVTRPALVGVPVAWMLAGRLCWRERRADRAMGLLVPVSAVLFVAHAVMLYSTSPHDTPAMVAHLGKVAGYLMALIAVASMGFADSVERHKAEEGLARLNRELESRVHSRTEELESANVFLETANRALTMLSHCNEALIRAEEEDGLLRHICRIAVDVGGYRSARVVYVNDDQPASFVVKAHAGESYEFQEALRAFWRSASPEGEAPTSMVLSGEPYVITSLADEPSLRDVAAGIRAAGVGGGILLPLKQGSRVFGLLSLYSSIGEATGEEELKLLRELADDLAFGIGILRSNEQRLKADQALVTSLAEKEALLKEVHHRVKNNMQVIVSLLRLESQRMNVPAVKVVLGDLQNRILAMALLHEALYKSNNFSRVDLSTYLRQLSTQLGRAVGRSEAIRFELDLAPAVIDLDQAVPCGLILNELISNSLKHAFPGGRAGTIRVVLESEAQGVLRLRVSDNGIGLPPDLDTKKGRSLGLQLVSDLARQLGGKFEINPGPAFLVTFTPTFAAHSAVPTPQTESPAVGDGPPTRF